MSAEPVLSTGEVERLVLETCVRGLAKSGPSPACQERQYLDFKLLVEPPLPSATITDLCNEPLFYSGYMSSEEDMSSDNMSLSSFSSAADDSFDEFESNFPELLAEDCTFVEQQCNQAEAVTLVSPGKAKMVRVSKVDLSSPLIKRPTSSSGHKHVRSSSRLSILSLRAHSLDSVPSASPKIPSTPDLDTGSQTPTSNHSPATPETPDSSFFDTLSAPSYNMTPTPKPRGRNYYGLRLSHMSKRADSIESFDAPASAPLTAPSIYQPKKLARGASERLTSIDLPPFPREQLLPAPKSSRPWILRKDSFGLLGSRDQTRNKLRRAESGALPSWR